MSFVRMHEDQVDSDAALVRRLLAAQLPEWADLSIERLPTDGTDNAVYRLGDELVARLPLTPGKVGQIELEHTWLPRLAPHLPLAIPEPLVIGEPGEGYPLRWSVYRWIDGVNAKADEIADLTQTARDLGAFVRTLHSIDLPDAPRSARGAPLRLQDEAIRGAIHTMRHELDAPALLRIWADALDAPKWDGPWVLIHGDLTDGNILVRAGRVHAVIDYSCFGFGDPATDFDVAWDLFSSDSRTAYREALRTDDATWARAKGWAVRSVFGIPYYRDTNPGIVARARRRLAAVIADD